MHDQLTVINTCFIMEEWILNMYKEIQNKSSNTSFEVLDFILDTNYVNT